MNMELQNIYDKMFDLSTVDGKVFSVRISSVSSRLLWYRNNMGQKYDVIEEDKDSNDYRVIKLIGNNRYYKDSFFIRKADVIIL